LLQIRARDGDRLAAQGRRSTDRRARRVLTHRGALQLPIETRERRQAFLERWERIQKVGYRGDSGRQQTGQQDHVGRQRWPLAARGSCCRQARCTRACRQLSWRTAATNWTAPRKLAASLS